MSRIRVRRSVAQGLLAFAIFPLVTSAYREQEAFLGQSNSFEPHSAPSFTPATYTAGPIRSVWKDGYYNDPTGIVEQPQPRVTDPIRCETVCSCIRHQFPTFLSGRIFAQNLSSPVLYPRNNTQDPAIFPPVPASNQLHTLFLNKLSEIIESPPSSFGGHCGNCLAALQGG